MKPDLFWLPGPWRGRLAIAARPRGGDWLDDEADGWRRAGVDVAVSLLEEDEATQLDLGNEREALERTGLQFISFPIPDRGTPSSVATAVSLMTNIAAALERGKNVVVHCRQGIGRSSVVAGGVLMASGMSSEKALGLISSIRGVAVPETPEQRAWVERLSSTLPIAAR
jgi:protein-tyrosine phosphatase